MPTVEDMSWAAFASVAKALAEALTGPLPEVLIGIARGGLPLLTTVASKLDIHEVGVALVRATMSDDPFADRLPVARFQGLAVSSELCGKRVAIVDDIIRSGRTVNAVLTELAAHQPAEVRVATMYAEDRPFTFDFMCSSYVTSDTWIRFPWDQ